MKPICTSCRRELRWQSIKLSLDRCRQCRLKDKRAAHFAAQKSVGQIVGRELWRAFYHRGEVR